VEATAPKLSILPAKGAARRRRFSTEALIKGFFGSNALVAILVLALITIFLFREGFGFFDQNLKNIRFYSRAGLEFVDSMRAQAERQQAYAQEHARPEQAAAVDGHGCVSLRAFCRDEAIRRLNLITAMWAKIEEERTFAPGGYIAYWTEEELEAAKAIARGEPPTLPPSGLSENVKDFVQYVHVVAQIAEATGVKFEWETFAVGADAYEKYGEYIPKEVIDSIERTRARRAPGENTTSAPTCSSPNAGC